MINPFQTGDTKTITVKVGENDTAVFETGQVHPVYATFALGRDAEWACRQFVLEMKEAHEEGIGTFLTVDHHAPALVGSEVNFTAKVESIERNEIICSYEARVGQRLIASGRTGQKIIKREKLDQLFDSLKENV